MSAVRLSNNEISIGDAVPWSVYDDKGALLLQKGSMITSEHQLSVLHTLGMYRDESREVEPDPIARKPITSKSNPFEVFDDLADQISGIFSKLVKKTDITYEELRIFCYKIIKLCMKDADAALGIVHLYHRHPYTICHPLHGAILSELITKSLGYDIERRVPVIAAALTANLGMLDLQEILHHQQTPLTDDQRECIRIHPDESIRILKEAGIEDQALLQIIKQHHERIDGGGYPDKLDESQIIESSQVVAIADRYAAMVTSRTYRSSIISKDALKEFFLQKGKLFEEILTLTFIKELGVFPPGTFITLKNGETAVVIEHGKESMWPIAASITGPRGAFLEQPVRRDCNIEEYSVHGVISSSEPLLHSLPSLWGYE